jgi:hypothetical protein
MTGYDARLTDAFVRSTISWVMTPRSLVDMELTSAQNHTGGIFLRKNGDHLPDYIELHRPSDRRLAVRLVPTIAGRGCCVVSATDAHVR